FITMCLSFPLPSVTEQTIRASDCPGEPSCWEGEDNISFKPEEGRKQGPL
uniref:Uncharacterized protein n=1 Tax=Otolemur garnettii TaxID=30611 RepID=H0XX38_OTOGA